jgi:hypothetical protein
MLDVFRVFLCKRVDCCRGAEITLKRRFDKLGAAYFSEVWSRDVPLPPSCDPTSIAKHSLSNGNVCYMFKKRVVAPPMVVIINIG